MSFVRLRRVVLFTVAICHALMSLVVVQPAFAQSSDRMPPEISFEPLGEGIRGDTQVFSALVVDDGGAVERVTLHYRVAGTNPYQVRNMTRLAGTDIYSVSIDDLDPSASAVEFYIDAMDVVGNRSIEGFAFDPLVRDLVEGSGAPVAATEPPVVAPAADGMSTRAKILLGVLGVVVVGALASADSGGGGSGALDAPVTVVADPLQ